MMKMKWAPCFLSVLVLVAGANARKAIAGPPCDTGFIGDLEMQNWASTGILGGTTSTSPNFGPTGSATFSYDVNLGNPGSGVFFRTATFSVSAPFTGPFSFDYDFSGFHAFFQAEAVFQVFANSSSGTETITIVDQATSGNFNFAGSTSIDIENGFSFGFIVGGSNGDANSRLRGDLLISNVNGDADSDTVTDDCDVCDGFDDTQDLDGDGIPNGCDDLQIPCPVDSQVFAPDGAFNALSCEITTTGALRPPFEGTFTNRGTPDNAVLTNNGVLLGAGSFFVTWINEAGATIENNSDWNFGAADTATQNAGTINNNATGLQSSTSLMNTNTGTVNNAGIWTEANGTLNTNAGDIFNLATGAMTLPRFENQPSGMLNSAGEFAMQVFSPSVLGSSNAGQIINSGTFVSNMTAGALPDTLFNNTATGTFVNESGGQATLAGGIENRGAMTNDARATIIHDLGNGVAFTVLEGGELNNAGTFESNSDFVISGPNATLNNTGTFNKNQNQSDLRIMDNATLNNQAGGSMNLFTTLQMGANNDEVATLNNFGTMNFSVQNNSGGDLRMFAATILNNESTGTINVDFARTSIISGTINNAGMIDHNLSVWLLNGPIVNQAGASLVLRNAAFITAGSDGASIDNAGIVNISSVPGINFGIVGRYTQTAGSSTIDSQLVAREIDFQGGTLGGIGTLEVTGVDPVTNSGATVEPGASTGTLTITGDYMQGPGGTYAVEIGVVAPDTVHDVLAVSGTATLAGTLTVTAINGFVPMLGDTFEILTAGGEINGQFDYVSVGGFPANLFVNVTYGVNVVTVEIVESANGDCVVDGLIDLFDFDAFHSCFTGPAAGPLSAACRCADFDSDDDVDLADFGAFQLAFSGSS
jgi:hypothetical protein